MSIYVTRPAPDGQPLVEALARHGVEAVLAPLMTIRFFADRSVDGTTTHIALTSANGARAIGGQAHRTSCPVYAIGPATANAAAAAGLNVTGVADGTAKSLASLIRQDLPPGSCKVLHSAGSHLSGDLAGELCKAGINCSREVWYEARAVSTLPAPLADALAAQTPHDILFYSPRTTRLYLTLALAAGYTDFSAVRAFGLSQAVLSPCDAIQLRACLAPKSPNQDAMIDIVLSHRT